MIYFAQLPGGSIKIGFTQDVDQRLKELRKYYKSDLVLLATMDGQRDREREIHDQFAHLRFGKTEQFRPATDLMGFIGKPMIVGINPDAVEVVRPTTKTIFVSLEFADILEEISRFDRVSVAEAADKYVLVHARKIYAQIIKSKYEKVKHLLE